MRTKISGFKIVLIIVLVFVIYISAVVVNQMYIQKWVIKHRFDKTRTEEALIMPDFSGNITDVRVTVVDRDVKFKGLEDVQLKQIYYGYYCDGKWTDIPCENYDLAGILFGNRSNIGFDAADQSHIVKIGPYLLVAIAGMGDFRCFENQYAVHDTLDSPVQEITKYYTSSNPEFANKGAKCNFLKEDVRSLKTDDFNYGISSYFPKWYYVVLEYDKIPTDYKLTIVQTFNLNGVEKVNESTLDYDDIQFALDNLNE